MFFFEQYFKFRNKVKSTFTRASSAYKQDLSVVTSGIPRIENSATARGIMIEEGTTNLMTQADSLLLSGAANVTVVSGTKYAVSCATGEITLSNGGSGIVIPATPLVITASSTTLTLTPTTMATCVQVERKDYKTSWITGGTTRAAESLSIPVNAYQKNLLTANQATGGDTLGDTTGFGLNGVGTIKERDTVVTHQGTGSIKITTPGTVGVEGCAISATGLTIGKIYTCSIYGSGSGNVRLTANDASYANGVSSTTVALSGAFVRTPITFVATTVTENIYYATYGIQAATFYIDSLQLEEGTTASDWTLPVVDYTNAVINPTAGTVEFDYTPTSDDTGAKYLFSFGDANNYISIITINADKYYQVSHKYKGGTARSIPSTIAAVTGTKKIHKIKWSGATLAYWINGVLIGTTIFDGLPSMLNWKIYFGTRFEGTLPRNGYLTNVRISSIARSDEELEYTGTLKPDRHTTYYRDFTKGV